MTTAPVTVTWAEVAIATGAPVIGGSPNLTTVGFLDVSATFKASPAGLRTVLVPVTAPNQIQEGDDLWILFGNQASTVTVLRADVQADDIQSGYAAVATVQPSTMAAASAFTTEGATVLAPWFTVSL